jgi:hypothetical protein
MKACDWRGDIQAVHVSSGFLARNLWSVGNSIRFFSFTLRPLYLRGTLLYYDIFIFIEHNRCFVGTACRLTPGCDVSSPSALNT